MIRFVSTRRVPVCAALAGASLAWFAATAGAQPRPAGEPVRWDQARVTQLAKDLNKAVAEAVHAVRKSPTQQQIAQRQSWYDLRESLRLLDNTTGHLLSELQKGAGREETLAVFNRVESLRKDAEETGRKSMIESSVMDALVKAGSIHNQMRPYYFGKT